MSRPPRPRAVPTREVVFRHDAAAWSSPARQVPRGFEDSEARCGDGTEFANDINHGKIKFLVGMVP
jgi:hypothetical protein